MINNNKAFRALIEALKKINRLLRTKNEFFKETIEFAIEIVILYEASIVSLSRRAGDWSNLVLRQPYILRQIGSMQRTTKKK
jgi:hypothetical protein